MHLVKMLFQVVHIIKDGAAKSTIKRSFFFDEFGNFLVRVKLVGLDCRLEGFVIQNLLECTILHFMLIDEEDR